jgi:NAD(P)H dehydrogenase (quinone)
MNAPPKPDYPIIKPDILQQYDAFILGIPTRYGIMPGQWKVCASLDPMLTTYLTSLTQAFWDATGSLWTAGKLAGKYAAIFVSTGTQSGGQETTVLTSLTTLTHHGIIFVPFGYSHAFAEIANFDGPHGGEFFFPT